MTGPANEHFNTQLMHYDHNAGSLKQPACHVRSLAVFISYLSIHMTSNLYRGLLNIFL